MSHVDCFEFIPSGSLKPFKISSMQMKKGKIRIITVQIKHVSRIKDTDKEDYEAKRRNKYEVESRCGG